MRVSEQWLRTLVDPPIDTVALAEKLTMAGLEVEATEPAAPPFSRVVVARVLAVAPHPNADRLTVCTVDAGRPPLSIVCGATNVRAGMTVPCALDGAMLPGGLAIRHAEVRGVASHGMLCSAKELGLDDDADGILALAGDLVPGTDLREALALDDTILMLKLTPNRADCLSMLGVAREVAAITGAKLAVPATPSAPIASGARRDVRIDEPQVCPRFGGRTIEGIDPKQSAPAWMKSRLARAGVRSISAVVDVTNYVMLELGQPMHAYDARQLSGALVVRFARAGEQLTLLNGDVLDLTPDLLLVCDEKKPLGLAGIMGGEHTGIADDTTSIYLEAAYWDPAVVQGRMRRLGFSSDAGFRFERGVDPELGPAAIERATALILAICGGRAGPRTDARAELPSRPAVHVRTSRVARLLGVPVSARDLADVFARLGLTARQRGADFDVTPPSWRFDLAIEEDFVEEFARIRGYESIPAASSAQVQHMLPQPESQRSPFALRRALAARDWQEVITFGFVSSETELALDPAAAPMRVINPIAAHLDVMRTSLIPGLIETLKTNASRKEPRVRVFEAGRVFRRAAGGVEQPLWLSGLAWGHALPEQWGSKPRPVDFYDVKGDLEAIAHPAALATAAAPHPALHPGRSAAVSIDGVMAGSLGELHPRLVRRYELGTAPVVFEIDLGMLLARRLPVGAPISRQPAVRRDLALVIDESIPVRSLVELLWERKPPFVVAIRPFDVFRGAALPTGAKSVAILVLMQDTARTLTDADIERTVAALAATAHQEFGATLRTQGSR